jgi:hypothetical protein
MRLASLTLSVSLLAACGGGGGGTVDAAKDIGFNKPKAPLHANMEGTPGMWSDLGVADTSCLDTPSSDAPTTVPVTLNTTVLDFQNSDPVSGATVTAFAGIDAAHPFATQMSDATDGTLSMTVPVGTERFGFKMAGGTSSSGVHLDTYLLFQYLDPDPTMTTQSIGKIQSVSSSTGTVLPALIGENRTPGTGVLAGAFRDCNHHEISNFVATVSSTQGTTATISGADTFYFSTASSPVPVLHNVADSGSANSIFMVIQLPVSPSAFVQMWGYQSQADVDADNLKLIAELEVPIIADTVITGSYEPLRQ